MLLVRWYPMSLEGLVLVLDVGPSMHALLPEIEKVCSMLVQKKLIYNKYDEVGVVVFGTADTKNDLTVEVGGYENVMVLRDVKVVDADLIEALQQLPQGSAHGDCIRFGKLKFGIQNMCSYGLRAIFIDSFFL
ncbi:UNVERIFIED_CONTAM: ATP-dependent DNA helicase 2 subunit KU80 [Sesamum angustifolium]|uniref:ATP-dependent DNA helicase 2 subunit KU80 n=1 Tax=Sesamum angustifolium TaxID=2727405 RepID=A0AAW2RHT6_9LAMI